MNLKKSELLKLIKDNKLSCRVDEKWCDGWTVTGPEKDFQVLTKAGITAKGIGVGLNYNVGKGQKPEVVLYVYREEKGTEDDNKEDTPRKRVRKRRRAK
jgi:hypothetical protein